MMLFFLKLGDILYVLKSDNDDYNTVIIVVLNLFVVILDAWFYYTI